MEAAAQLFARQGFKAATTREIAQLADLNEATLFRYFPRKPDLFWAAVESRLSRVRLGRDIQASLAADDDPANVVPMIVSFLLHTLSQQPELPRLLQVATFELPNAEIMICEHLGPIFDSVNGYFLRCADKGVIGKVEPSLAAFGLLGVVLAHQSFCKLFGVERVVNSNSEEASAALAKLWLQALQPPMTSAVTCAL